MKCPCEDCLIKPICRNKKYTELHNTCDIITKYLSFLDITQHEKRVKCLEQTLQSTVWQIGKRLKMGFKIEPKRH